mmetsp:Transcript_12626/g.30644  ORF Transcript_12626/g.30644 Transcript_12626/m.30644 type:complete len:209 (-) Transcript_12626:711-1337(-)
MKLHPVLRLDVPVKLLPWRLMSVHPMLPQPVRHSAHLAGRLGVTCRVAAACISHSLTWVRKILIPTLHRCHGSRSLGVGLVQLALAHHIHETLAASLALRRVALIVHPLVAFHHRPLSEAGAVALAHAKVGGGSMLALVRVANLGNVLIGVAVKAAVTVQAVAKVHPALLDAAPGLWGRVQSGVAVVIGFCGTGERVVSTAGGSFGDV